MKLKLVLLALLPFFFSAASAQMSFEGDFAGYSFQRVGGFAPYFGTVDLEALPDGDLLVCLKAGVVVIVDEQTGAYAPESPLLDIRDEVNSFGDSGLMSMLLDPEFPEQPYIYFSLAKETETDPANHDLAEDKYMQIVRYQLDASANYKAIVPGSKQVLLGQTWSDGILQEGFFHTSGDMKWGTDGTMLVTTGDSHVVLSYQPLDNDSYLPGRFDPSLNIGPWRAQTLNNLNGKVLRLDRHTGDGLPTNPFWNGSPRDAESRLWAIGLREPWRMAIKPGTGSFDPDDGNPGVLYVGDVGKEDFEELNATSPGGGDNFGWPFWEGTFRVVDPVGYAGPTPYLEYAETDPAAVGFQHADRPMPSFPPVAEPVALNSLTAGVFYDYATRQGGFSPYSPVLDDKFIFADWGFDGFFLAAFNEQEEPTEIIRMSDSSRVGDGGGGEAPVDFFLHPGNGKIYIATFWNVFRLDYNAAGAPPTAVLEADRQSGALPLLVNFDGSNTIFPSTLPVFEYRWYVDEDLVGTTSLPDFQYTFTEDRNYEVRMEAEGPTGTGATQMTIFAGNDPPEVEIVSPSAFDKYPADGARVWIELVGEATDPESAPLADAYWEVAIGTEEGALFHSLGTWDSLTAQVEVGAFDQPAFHRVRLFVTDARGQTTVEEVRIFPEGEGPERMGTRILLRGPAIPPSPGMSLPDP